MKRKMMLAIMISGFIASMLPYVTHGQWARAEGGDLQFEEQIDGATWMIHVFANVGEHVDALEITQSGNLEYLIIGGGGSGGTARRSGPTAVAGGGAGGLLQGTTNVTVGATTVTVGGGGEPSSSRADPGGNGEDSSAFGLTAIGGGGGGSSTDWPAGSGGTDGQDGGSGGGAARVGSSAGGIGEGTPGQGHDGALATSDSVAGGGGGAGGPGDGSSGGAGLESDITGETITYARGGDGGDTGVHGNSDYSGQDGAANTGTGGEGAISSQQNNEVFGGSGGSGIVVVRYQVDPPATKTWTGDQDSEWTNENNWDPVGEPGTEDNVSIPDVSGAGGDDPVIGPTDVVMISNLTVKAGATLTIESDSSGTGALIVNGTQDGDGTVIAERYLPQGSRWYLVGSSVLGQEIGAFLEDRK